jgi:hypothetical protein
MSRRSRNQQRKARALVQEQGVPYQHALQSIHAESRAVGGSRVSVASNEVTTYLAGRGFDDHTTEHFALTFDDGAPPSGRLIIPILDKIGVPITVARRALYDQHPCQVCGVEVTSREMVKRRYLADKAKHKGEASPVGEWDTCPYCGAGNERSGLRFLDRQIPVYLYQDEFVKDGFLYHQNGARLALQEEACAGLFLVEGYSDAWAVWQAGQHAVCAYMGAILSTQQAQEATALAAEATKSIILVPDNDHTGAISIGLNIARLRACKSGVTISVVKLDDLRPPCIDIANVLQVHGNDKVAKVLGSAHVADVGPTAMYCVNEIATAATTAKASDIHLREGSEPYFRCGGTLIASGFAPYLTKGALAELRNYANEGDVSEAGFEIAEVRAPSSVFGARWRVAVFAESAVLRHISDLPL